MAIQNCSSIRAELLNYIGKQTDVTGLRDSCIITLPLRTVDDRWVDVYIEQRNADYFIVHDAGKTVSELLSHGLNLTESKISLLGCIAQRFGANVNDGSFMRGCKLSGLQEAIMAIAQCASLGMIELLKHSANFAELPLTTALDAALHSWAGDRASVESRVVVQGESVQHTFDFVCRPLADNIQTVAVSILRPSYTPMATAKLYGFTILDLGRKKSGWKKMAILAKDSEWTEDARELIRKHAGKVISIASADLRELKTELPSALDELVA